MDAELEDRFTAVLGVADATELLEEVVRFTEHLEFERATAIVVVDRRESEPQFSCVFNAPQSYRHLASDAKRSRCDPVAQHVKNSSMPILWDRSNYVVEGLMDKWEEQAPFGYETGIALAFHMPNGRHFALGIDRKGDLPKCAVQVSRLVAELGLFASQVQDAAFRLLLPQMKTPDTPSLTARELECLRWTAEGKTAWEVGRILSISEQTAVRHLNNATRKLECVNKHHAVVKALRLGLMQ